jgi:hypothetical protein
METDRGFCVRAEPRVSRWPWLGQLVGDTDDSSRQRAPSQKTSHDQVIPLGVG